MMAEDQRIMRPKRQTQNKDNLPILVGEKCLPQPLLQSIDDPKVSIEDSFNAILSFFDKDPHWRSRTCSTGYNIAHRIVLANKIELANMLLSDPKLTEGAKFMFSQKKKLETGIIRTRMRP